MTYYAKLRPEDYRLAAARGLTQTEAARILGVSLAAVHKAKRRLNLTFHRGKSGQKIMTQVDKPKLIAAYERIEREAGGIAEADMPLCLTKAAAECGVAYPEAKEIMRLHWAGTAGRG